MQELDSRSVLASGVTAARLDLWQGNDRPQRVSNTDSAFAPKDEQLDAVVLKDSGLVFARAIETTGDTSQIRWQLEREAGGPMPAVVGSPGVEVSFQPDVAGNFRLTATVKGGNDQFFVARFAIVHVTLPGAHNFRTGDGFLRTGLAEAPVSGMSLSAVYLLLGGGGDLTRGTSKIVVGNVANLTLDNLQVNYPATDTSNVPGTGMECAGGNPPRLDTKNKVSGTGGCEVFRGASTMEKPVSGFARGLGVRLSSSDSPDFVWDDPDPVTGNPARSMSGGNVFLEFVVAFSTCFPKTYTALYQAPWIATPCAGRQLAVVPTMAVQPGAQPIYDGTRLFSPRMSYDKYVPPSAMSVSVGGCGHQAPNGDGRAMDFALGQTIGSALTGECGIVYGELLANPPDSAGTIAMRIARTIWGDSEPGATIEIPYAPRGTSRNSGGRLARSWDHVQFAPGVRAMAVLTRRRMGELRPGEPVLVTSRNREFKIVDSLVAEEVLLAAQQWNIRDAVASASAGEDSARVGHLYARIWYREALSDPELATRLYRQMLCCPAIPAEAWPEIAEDIVLSFALLAAGLQASTIAHFAECAKSLDDHAGFAGFRGLGQIAQFCPVSVSSTDSTRGLAEPYRRLVKEAGMPREQKLEDCLSISLE